MNPSNAPPSGTATSSSSLLSSGRAFWFVMALFFGGSFCFGLAAEALSDEPVVVTQAELYQRGMSIFGFLGCVAVYDVLTAISVRRRN